MWLSRLYGCKMSETVGFGHHAVLLLECSKDGARKPTLSCLRTLLLDANLSRPGGGATWWSVALGEDEREYRKHVRKLMDIISHFILLKCSLASQWHSASSHCICGLPCSW